MNAVKNQNVATSAATSAVATFWISPATPQSTIGANAYISQPENASPGSLTLSKNIAPIEAAIPNACTQWGFSFKMSRASTTVAAGYSIDRETAVVALAPASWARK